MILNTLDSKPLPVPGGGLNEPDWIYVEDRASRLVAMLECEQIGQTYLLGDWAVRDNRALVKGPYTAFDRLRLKAARRERLITFVADHLLHDRPAAIDYSKAERDLGCAPPGPSRR